MSKKKTETTVNERKIYEFKPEKEVTNDNIRELLGLIRIGIGGDTLEKASPELKALFKEVA